jgi:hypothetical protein
MTIETATRTIQFVLAPVIMVTACSLLLNGILTRYTTRSNRIRLMTRERLDLVFGIHKGDLAAERLTEIDLQLPLMKRQLNLAHKSIVAIYTADAVFILDMFIIALSLVPGARYAPVAAVVLFLVGVAIVLVGITLTALEVSTSKEAILLEMERSMRIPVQPAHPRD